MNATELMDLLCVPVLVHRDGKLLYINEAGREVAIRFGLQVDRAGNPTMETLWDLVVPEEREAARKNYFEVLAEGRVVTNIPRTLRDAHGRRYRALGSVRPVEWDGKTALLVSFVFLDPWPPSPGGEDSPDARVDTFSQMTDRQREVAMLAAQGYGVPNIAAILNISEETVKGYLKDVYRTLGIHSRVELLRLLVGLDSPRCSLDGYRPG